MIRKRGLAFKLSIYLLTAIFCILFALLYYNYMISRNLLLNDAKKDAQNLTDLTVARIENTLQKVEGLPLNLASVIENRDTILLIKAREVIEEVLVDHPLVYGASISFAPRIENGDTTYFAPYLYSSGDSIVFKDLAMDEYKYTQKPWYVNARDKGKSVWSEPYFDKGGGDAMMATFSVPFYRKHGSKKYFAGVVTADISLEGLQDLIKGIQFFDSGFGFLISSQGNIVTWRKFDVLDSTIVHNVFEKELSKEGQQLMIRMVNGEKGIVSLDGIGEKLNQHNWVSFAHVPDVDWSLGIIFHEDELYKGLDNLYAELMGIGLFGFLVMGLMIFIISRRFVKPIEKLAFATNKIGAGDFEFSIPSFRSQDEIAQLGKSFQLMQVQLKEYVSNLQKTTAIKEKMESELQIAANIQQQMLPVRKPIPGREAFDFYGVLKPARQIGGDLYDFILKDEYLYFTIGDVAGKGIPAALFMAKTLTLFRAKVASGDEPKIIAEDINRDLEQYNEQSMFVTFFIGKLHIQTGELLYTNAGHNHPFILRKGEKAETLKGTHGLPLGSLPDVEFDQATIKLSPGEKIILYTDGVTEANNLGNELFGDHRLENILNDHATCSPEEMAEIISSSVDSFASGAEQADDITLLILEYN